jgi:hypothetical protein
MVESCEACATYLCMGCLMKGVGEAASHSAKAAMKAHVKTCAHIQGRGKDEWAATKQSFARRVGETVDASATDDDKNRRIAAFRLVNAEIVLKFVTATAARRVRRNLVDGALYLVMFLAGAYACRLTQSLPPRAGLGLTRPGHSVGRGGARR